MWLIDTVSTHFCNLLMLLSSNKFLMMSLSSVFVQIFMVIAGIKN